VQELVNDMKSWGVTGAAVARSTRRMNTVGNRIPRAR
jgi:hypothetical protein